MQQVYHSNARTNLNIRYQLQNNSGSNSCNSWQEKPLLPLRLITDEKIIDEEIIDLIIRVIRGRKTFAHFAAKNRQKDNRRRNNRFNNSCNSCNSCNSWQEKPLRTLRKTLRTLRLKNNTTLFYNSFFLK